MARRTPGPIPRVHRAWRLPPRRNSEGLSKGSASYCSDAYRQRAWQARRPFARLLVGQKTGQTEAGWPQSCAPMGNTRRSGWRLAQTR
jgi:hypothetical protein